MRRAVVTRIAVAGRRTIAAAPPSSPNAEATVAGSAAPGDFAAVVTAAMSAAHRQVAAVAGGDGVALVVMRAWLDKALADRGQPQRHPTAPTKVSQSEHGPSPAAADTASATLPADGSPPASPLDPSLSPHDPRAGLRVPADVYKGFTEEQRRVHRAAVVARRRAWQASKLSLAAPDTGCDSLVLH